jgi:hypothetical protein
MTPIKDLSETGREAMLEVLRANERLLWEYCSEVVDGIQQVNERSPYYKGWRGAVALLKELEDG